MYSASRTSRRSTSRYSFAANHNNNVNGGDSFTNYIDLDAPFTSVQLRQSDKDFSESREVNIPGFIQHNNGNGRSLYTSSLPVMHSEGNPRDCLRNDEYWTRTITNSSRSVPVRNNEPQYEQRATGRRRNHLQAPFLGSSHISWLGQHPHAFTSIQQHYGHDSPDLSQKSSNEMVLLPESETSKSVHSSQELIPELFLFSIFDAIMKHLNAKYALRSSLKNSRYVALLRVPILKRSFGGFKGTCILAKELVAEMALKELIKQMPHVVYIVLKSKGLDDVMDINELEELCANENKVTMESKNGLKGSHKQIHPICKEHCCEEDIEIEKLDESNLKTYCPIESSKEKSSTIFRRKM
ncbi:6989_t:CDS:2 [Dentiscutata erythropus]|uniref:6989_t:CDS:1 n=1 Tax=Dentiscutata erythropus TaxID=1348616 RepID=A0A9N8ZX23_9GLOM|nr:6989_t:CDS:2 [Dentiscutata erythropus]